MLPYYPAYGKQKRRQAFWPNFGIFEGESFPGCLPSITTGLFGKADVEDPPQADSPNPELVEGTPSICSILDFCNVRDSFSVVHLAATDPGFAQSYARPRKKQPSALTPHCIAAASLSAHSSKTVPNGLLPLKFSEATTCPSLTLMMVPLNLSSMLESASG